MRAFVGVVCLFFVAVPVSAGAGADLAVWGSESKCVYVDDENPSNSRVDLLRCSSLIGTSGDECVYVNESNPPESRLQINNCSPYVGTTEEKCIYIDEGNPTNSRVNFNKCNLP